MFGYLLPCKPEMKVKEFEAYRSVYCGLCKQLADDYGLLGRMFLNYDLVLVSLMADGLSGQEGRPCAERCMVNPRRRCMLRDTEGLRLAADGLILTVWYKLADDMADEGLVRRMGTRMLRLLARRLHRKAAARRPELDRPLAHATADHAAEEKEGGAGDILAADPTARMTGALFAACAAEESQRTALYRMGLFLGKIIYYLDAAEDFGSDVKKGRYNVFALHGLDAAGAIGEARRQCRAAAAEAARSYTMLNLRLNKPIWDNIVYLGLPQSIAQAGQPRAKQKGSYT